MSSRRMNAPGAAVLEEPPEAAQDQPVATAPPAAAAGLQNLLEEVGDFIARQVLEKDSRFFEG
jgi:hypothetical protein